VLPGLLLPQIEKEANKPIEVYLEAGDLLVHDPMLTHSASDNLGAGSPGRVSH
jgi:ectoine hydroxylase-related dioxygenase (phytanoyl-CoA dioxygenase family)